MEENIKKKKKKFSFLESLSAPRKGKSTWGGKAGSYLEGKKSKTRRLAEVFK